MLSSPAPSCVYCCCSVTMSCPILCNPMDCSLPGYLKCLLNTCVGIGCQKFKRCSKNSTFGGRVCGKLNLGMGSYTWWWNKKRKRKNDLRVLVAVSLPEIEPRAWLLSLPLRTRYGSHLTRAFKSAWLSLVLFHSKLELGPEVTSGSLVWREETGSRIRLCLMTGHS